jgi:hypothetical protein
MKRSGPALALAFVVVAVSSAPAGAAAKFASSPVSRASRAAEPKVYVDSRTRPPTVYVAAPADGPSSQLWRSADGGRTFRKMAATAAGGGDSDVVVDAKGTLYVADLFDAAGGAKFPVSTSYDGGRTYARVVNAAPEQNDLDRQWIASNAAGHLVGTATSGEGTLFAWVSKNAARYFDGPFAIAKNITIQGPVVTGPGRVYYTVYTDASGVHYARSRDGADWDTGMIAAGHASTLFPVIAADTGSNLYAVWSESSAPFFSGPVYLARSTNGGRTWTRPAAVSPARADAFGTTPSAIFPWVVAGARGRVAVSYAIAHQLAGPDLGASLGGPQTTWDYVLAQSMNALSARPVWSSTVIARGAHVGSICPDGTGCPGPQQFGFVNLPTPFDRRDLDFAGADVDSKGNVYVAYNRDRPPTSGDPNDVVTSHTDIVLARQTGGPKLR